MRQRDHISPTHQRGWGKRAPTEENGIHGGFQKHSTAFNAIHSTTRSVNSTLNIVENVENSRMPRKSMWKTMLRTGKTGCQTDRNAVPRGRSTKANEERNRALTWDFYREHAYFQPPAAHRAHRFEQPAIGSGLPCRNIRIPPRESRITPEFSTRWKSGIQFSSTFSTFVEQIVDNSEYPRWKTHSDSSKTEFRLNSPVNCAYNSPASTKRR
jgi:hypothetical protein